MRIALVHDWLTGMRGGEYVLEAIAELLPQSELFTLLYVPGKVSPTLSALKRHTSGLQKVPGAATKYRHFLPLMPSLIESFDLSGFDLIVSSSHCVAKGIRKPKDAVHISYVHAPMRYIWDRYDEYFGPGQSSLPVRIAARLVRRRLQDWDRRSSSPERIDQLIANSHFIAQQIEAAYGRKSLVIHPFAQLDRFHHPRTVGHHYLIVTAFAPYKRIDLAIEAFNELKLPLLIVGSGQNEAKLKALAGPQIEFLGALSNAAIADLYARCKAFIFPGVEDFGITPIEAMAAGAPVIALQEGGATETVTEKTGVFFSPQTVEALKEAILKIETGQVKIQASDCRARAQTFTRERFKSELAQTLLQVWTSKGKSQEELLKMISL